MRNFPETLCVLTAHLNRRSIDESTTLQREKISLLHDPNQVSIKPKTGRGRDLAKLDLLANGARIEVEDGGDLGGLGLDESTAETRDEGERAADLVNNGTEVDASATFSLALWC